MSTMRFCGAPRPRGGSTATVDAPLNCATPGLGQPGISGWGASSATAEYGPPRAPPPGRCPARRPPARPRDKILSAPGLSRPSSAPFR
eukprot:1004069-Pyramimonas_sp.AAC.1